MHEKYLFLTEVGDWDVSSLIWEYPNFINYPPDILHSLDLHTFNFIKEFKSRFEFSVFLEEKLSWSFVRADRFALHVLRNYAYWDDPDSFSIFEDDPKSQYGNFHYSRNTR